MKLRSVLLLMLSALFSVMLGVLPVLAQSVEVTAYTLTRVRSGPGTEYSVIGLMIDGDSFTVNGRNSTSNTWLRIDFDGTEGWVASSVVSVEGDPTTLEIVSPTSGEVTVGNTDVTATIGEEATNIRVGPDTSYPAVDQAEAGTVYDVTGRTPIDYPLVCRGSNIVDVTGGDEADDIWLRINYEGFNAWISYSVVSVDGNLCDVAEADVDDVVTEGLEDVEAFVNQVAVSTLENVNLRASNYPASDIIDTIPYDTTLIAEARNDDSSRIRVTYQDQTGWISTGYIEVISGTIDSLPVELE